MSGRHRHIFFWSLVLLKFSFLALSEVALRPNILSTRLQNVPFIDLARVCSATKILLNMSRGFFTYLDTHCPVSPGRKNKLVFYRQFFVTFCVFPPPLFFVTYQSYSHTSLNVKSMRQYFGTISIHYSWTLITLSLSTSCFTIRNSVVVFFWQIFPSILSQN